MIKLEGSGIITYWTFPPNQTNCPVRRCEIDFASRSHAIIHYKSQHAKEAVLCELCSKPVSAHAVGAFIEHYQRVHPFKKIPYGLDEMDAQCLEKQVW